MVGEPYALGAEVGWGVSCGQSIYRREVTGSRGAARPGASPQYVPREVRSTFAKSRSGYTALTRRKPS